MTGDFPERAFDALTFQGKFAFFWFFFFFFIWRSDSSYWKYFDGGQPY